MATPTHIDGIRMTHISGGERSVQVHATRPPAGEGPIAWAKVQRECGLKVRTGHGKSGLLYRVTQGREWQVVVLGSRGREVVVGSARLSDHALALAGMWEQAVLGGRVDMD